MSPRPSLRTAISLVIVIGVLTAAGFIYLSTPRQANPQSTPSQFTVNGKAFGITYVATNEAEWKEGLNDKKVTNTTTMLFIFPEPAVYPFWMDRVNTSLDIIWLNVTGSVGHVVYLVASAPVCSPVECPNYVPSSAANWVIEAKGGFAAANGLGVGGTVQFG